jgi:hypothetical protein
MSTQVSVRYWQFFILTQDPVREQLKNVGIFNRTGTAAEPHAPGRMNPWRPRQRQVNGNKAGIKNAVRGREALTANKGFGGGADIRSGGNGH